MEFWFLKRKKVLQTVAAIISFFHFFDSYINWSLLYAAYFKFWDAIMDSLILIFKNTVYNWEIQD